MDGAPTSGMAGDEIARQRRALDSVEACLDLEGEARDAELARLDREDPQLADDVRRLLAHDTQAGVLMPTDGPGLRTVDIPPPERIGVWRIDGVLGEGGMGAVYRGVRDDGVFEQTVAIKLIRGAVASPYQEERFALERQILARLNSPAICRILDGGTWEGRPFLIMEYVDGEPLTDAPPLSLRERLRTFLAVCAAVQYAHRALIVHADLKPSNILVTRDGAVKLLDFGIARLLEQEQDALGAAALTRAYAAPERRAGEPASVAGDVYSLGVILFELLTGARGGAEPYDGDVLPLASGLAGDPATARALRGDLDAIIARAVAADPARRYPDVAGLVGDVEAWLDSRPVTARKPDWRYLTARFARRHRRPLGVAAAVGLLLVAATGVSLVQWRRAEHARADASARFDDARGAARYLLFELMDKEAQRPSSLVLRNEIARNAQHYLDRLSRSSAASPEVRFEAASGLWKLAQAQGVSGRPNLGQPEKAQANLERAEAIAAQLSGSRAEVLLAHIRLDRARVAMELQFDPAKAQVLLENCRLSVERAARFEPDLRGDYQLHKAILLGWQGRYPQAVEAGRAALALTPTDDSRRSLLKRADVVDAIGEALYYGEGPAQAVAQYRPMLAQLQAAHRRWPADNYVHFRLAREGWNVGVSLLDQKRPAEALPVIEQADLDAAQVLAFDPDDYTTQRMARIAHTAHAQVLAAAGRKAEGIDLLRAVVARAQAQWTANPTDAKRLRELAYSVAVLGEVLDTDHRAAEACVTDRRALDLYAQAQRMGALTAFDASNNMKLGQARIARNCAGR